MTAGSLPYDQWIEDALRGVVQQALAHTARYGLPGKHHFYITFATGAEGVEMPAELRAKYREDMTIVLQHQFWDLVVDEKALAVTLKFGGQPQRLRVPLAAITAFGDPSVNFGMHLKAIAVAGSLGKREEPAAGSLPPLGADAGAKDRDVGEREPQKSDSSKVIALDTFRKK